jgi:hypothetical protein
MSTLEREAFLQQVFGISDPKSLEHEEYLLDITFQGSFLTKDELQAHQQDPDALVTLWDSRVLAHLKSQYGIDLQSTNVRIDEVANQWTKLEHA